MDPYGDLVDGLHPDWTQARDGGLGLLQAAGQLRTPIVQVAASALQRLLFFCSLPHSASLLANHRRRPCRWTA